ncbi:MAG: hypothetical protein VYA60_04730 [Pseudomonadota bacterium]|nr:hypothetical protein [Pseudomonadota bacterium]
MLFDFLIEIIEEKIKGKDCFVLVVARHSARDINDAAKVRWSENYDQVGYTALKAVVDQVEHDKQVGNVDVTLFSNKIEVLYFDSSNKDQVFYAALAKAVYWLMKVGVNRGRYMVYSKIQTTLDLGDDRPYEGFSSFAHTPTNSKSHSIIVDNINKVVNSQELRENTVKRIVGDIDSQGVLVGCHTSTIEESKKTIEDFLCMGLFVIPIKTQDLMQTNDWFNENYAKEIGAKQLTLVQEYKSKIESLKRSILAAVESSTTVGDIEDLEVVVAADKYEQIKKRLADTVYICSASEAIWHRIIVKESLEAKMESALNNSVVENA